MYFAFEINAYSCALLCTLCKMAAMVLIICSCSKQLNGNENSHLRLM